VCIAVVDAAEERCTNGSLKQIMCTAAIDGNYGVLTATHIEALYQGEEDAQQPAATSDG
jgi:hypothetical protein